MTYLGAVGTEGVDIGVGGVGAVADVEVSVGRIDIDAVGVGECVTVVLQNGCGLQGVGIDTVKIG